MTVMDLYTLYTTLKSYDPNISYWQHDGDNDDIINTSLSTSASKKMRIDIDENPITTFDSFYNSTYGTDDENTTLTPTSSLTTSPTEMKSSLFSPTEMSDERIPLSSVFLSDNTLPSWSSQQQSNIQSSHLLSVHTEPFDYTTLESMSPLISPTPSLISNDGELNDVLENILPSKPSSLNVFSIFDNIDDVNFDDLYEDLTSVETAKMFYNEQDLEDSTTTQQQLSVKNDETSTKKIETESAQRKGNKRKSLQQPIGRCRKVRSNPNNCYHLWDFIKDVLDDSNNSCVVWINKDLGEFRITNTSELSLKWGKLKNSKNMTYDKLSRSLRYYCTLNVLEKVPGTRLQFRFGKRRTWAKEVV